MSEPAVRPFVPAPTVPAVLLDDLARLVADPAAMAAAIEAQEQRVASEQAVLNALRRLSGVPESKRTGVRMTVGQAIVAVLETHRDGLPTGEIRPLTAELIGNVPEGFHATFYREIYRMHRSGRIRKVGRLYYPKDGGPAETAGETE